jgi:undecaprenyl-diphosphatase
MPRMTDTKRFLTHRLHDLLRRLDFRLLLYILLIFLLVWAFLEIAESVQAGATDHLDARILLSLRAAGPEHPPLGPAWLPGAVRDLTALGSGTVLVFLTLAVALGFFLQRRWKTALFLLTTVIVGWSATNGLKERYGRQRPTVVPHLTRETSLSFPSGHARMSALVYLTLGAILAQRAKKRGLKLYWILLALVLTLLVGMSRVYLGVHNPSDVLAGWCVGAAWALLAFLLARLWRYRVLLQRWRVRHNLATPNAGGA